jgi:hypothetical protein
VRGVKEVQDGLDRHETAENIPSLQGGKSPRLRRWGIVPKSPGFRLLGELFGSALVVSGAVMIGRALGNAGAPDRADALPGFLNEEQPSTIEVFACYTEDTDFPVIR